MVTAVCLVQAELAGARQMTLPVQYACQQLCPGVVLCWCSIPTVGALPVPGHCCVEQAVVCLRTAAAALQDPCHGDHHLPG